MISILAGMNEITSYRDTTCIPDHANGFPASLESLGIVYDTAGGFKTDKTRLYAELSKKFQNLSFQVKGSAKKRSREALSAFKTGNRRSLQLVSKLLICGIRTY